MAMLPIVQWYLKLGLVYLGLGSTLGFLLSVPATYVMLVHLSPGRWSLAHAHLNLLGFLLMLVFGIAYHAVPRFSGRGAEPYSLSLAAIQFWLFNIGLWLLLAGFVLKTQVFISGIGGILLLTAIYIFIFNLWRSMSAD